MVTISQAAKKIPATIEGMKPKRIPFTPENVRETRKARNLSQLELAELAGVSHMTARKCEMEGANPTLTVMKQLGKALGVVFTAE